MKDQLVLHRSHLLFSFDLRGMRRSSKAKAAKAKKKIQSLISISLSMKSDLLCKS